MAEKEQEAGEETKSSKKMIMIIALVVLLVGGGGAGYYFMFGDSAKTEGDTTEATEESVEEESEAASDAVYYDMASSLIVNFPKGSSASLIQVSVSLLVQDEAKVADVKKHEPMIRNNLLMAISSQGADKLMTKEGKEELRAMMLKEMGDVMERMTKKNPVKDVFFTTFVMQ